MDFLVWNADKEVGPYRELEREWNIYQSLFVKIEGGGFLKTQSICGTQVWRSQLGWFLWSCTFEPVVHWLELSNLATGRGAQQNLQPMGEVGTFAAGSRF